MLIYKAHHGFISPHLIRQMNQAAKRLHAFGIPVVSGRSNTQLVQLVEKWQEAKRHFDEVRRRHRHMHLRRQMRLVKSKIHE